jgi:hypothetical protein
MLLRGFETRPVQYISACFQLDILRLGVDGETGYLVGG